MGLSDFSLRGSLLTLALCIGSSLSLPAEPNQVGTPLNRRAISNGVALRILPIGDSITAGIGSSDNNGYRLDLENLLNGNPVQYVGTVRSGSMTDNFSEGHSGAVIDEIRSFMQISLPDRPNVVLIMAGTNDINRPLNPDTAPSRLEGLLDDVLKACPDAAVILAQITPINNADSQARANTYNAALPAIVNSRAQAGKKILLVNMNDYIKVGDLNDGLHPNDAGYRYMANAWHDGIVKAGNNGWIQQPVTLTTHTITNQKTGLAIDDNGSSTNGNGVTQWHLNSGPNQVWQFTQNADTSWNIINPESRQSLDVPNSSTDNGVQIIQWEHSGNDNQRWWVDVQSDGSYKIWNKKTSKALDGASSTTDAAPLIQFDWNGGSQQRWILH